MSTRHFLTLLDFSRDELQGVLDRAIVLKKMHYDGVIYEPLKNKVLGMIFEKSSTRTRVSFEAGMAQFGGSAIFLSPRDTQLGRGEPVEDAARVISRMVDVVMIRTFGHDIIQRFADYSRVPVINALTDQHHPCQLLADLQTFIEQRGALSGKTFAWIGDGNNMCNSYIHAAHIFDFQLKIACPYGFEPDPELLEKYARNVELVKTAEDAAKGAHSIATDVWTSMGQESETSIRKRRFSMYQINPRLMDMASSDAIFMHCLPAHRGEEISEDMLDDDRSVVWDEAENRLHAQKALLEFLVVGPGGVKR
jgi:ornithine carbamoyltransferase